MRKLQAGVSHFNSRESSLSFVSLLSVVGAGLHAAARASDVIADAHVVAVCAAVDAAVVVTTDPDDINALAAGIPGTRVVARTPSLVAPGR